jgi:hypothetical protein
MLFHVFQVRDDAEFRKSLEIYQQRHGCPPVAVWVAPGTTHVSASPPPSIAVIESTRMAAGYVYLEVPGQRHPLDGQLGLPLVNVK